jgi:hypothetical protein
MIAADQRFSRALKCDDIRAMREALAEKSELLQLYFAASRRGGGDGNEEARPAASFR